MKTRRQALPGEGAKEKARCPTVIQVVLLGKLKCRVWHFWAVIRPAIDETNVHFYIKSAIFHRPWPLPQFFKCLNLYIPVNSSFLSSFEKLSFE